MKPPLLPAAALALFGAALFGAATARAAVEYTVTDLGRLNGEILWSAAFAVNDHGQATGWATPEAPEAMRHHAFRGDGGPMTDLGKLGGDSSHGNAINASGQVAGYYVLPGEQWLPLAFRTDAAGVMSPLGTLGGPSSTAFGINASGQVVGIASTDVASRAFRTDAAGVMRDMGTLGGRDSWAMAINDSGQVSGRSDTTADNTIHAFRADAAGVMTDLGSLGGPWAEGRAINASGQVAGFSSLVPGGIMHAFRTDAAGAMTDLGAMGGVNTYGWGINDAGDVVGDVAGPNGPDAFLFTDGRGMVSVNTLIDPASGWSVYGALDINNAGQIAAYAFRDGRGTAVLLTPVPEPSAGLAPLGLGLLALRGRRRHAFHARRVSPRRPSPLGRAKAGNS